jgi:hypothetical protein
MRPTNSPVIWSGSLAKGEIMAGLALVAAYIRDALLKHANGCDCGSDAWLDRAIYANAVDDDDA